MAAAVEATSQVLTSVTSSTIQLGSTVISATGTGIFSAANSIGSLGGLQPLAGDDAADLHQCHRLSTESLDQALRIFWPIQV